MPLKKMLLSKVQNFRDAAGSRRKRLSSPVSPFGLKDAYHKMIPDVPGRKAQWNRLKSR
jgi:hypothetical protein